MKRSRGSKHSKYEQVSPYEENNLLVFFIFNCRLQAIHHYFSEGPVLPLRGELGEPVPKGWLLGLVENLVSLLCNVADDNVTIVIDRSREDSLMK